MANKMYVANNLKLKTKYKQLIKDSFRAEADEVNFGQSKKTTATINKWVRENTRGKIDNIFKES